MRTTNNNPTTSGCDRSMVLEILEYGFIQRALLSGVVIASTCSFVGCFLVMRRLALFGDGIAHVAFGGIAAGLFMGTYPMGTAFVAAVLGSLGLQKLRASAKIPGEIAVAITLVSGLSAGVILTSMSGGFTVDLFSFLFGSIILVGTVDTIMILAVSAAVCVILAVLYRRFLFITFNEEMARLSGINTTALNYLFVALAAVTVVAAMRLTGILLITALIVLPAITAARLNRSFRTTVIMSVIMSSSAVVGGIMLSYVLDWAPSGTIVFILVANLILVHAGYKVLHWRRPPVPQSRLAAPS